MKDREVTSKVAQNLRFNSTEGEGLHIGAITLLLRRLTILMESDFGNHVPALFKRCGYFLFGRRLNNIGKAFTCGVYRLYFKLRHGNTF